MALSLASLMGSMAPPTSGGNWKDIINSTGFWAAPQLIESLTNRAAQAGDPNYDWTPAVQAALDSHRATYGGAGGRTTPAPSVVDDIIAVANTQVFGGPRVDPAERQAAVEDMGKGGGGFIKNLAGSKLGSLLSG